MVKEQLKNQLLDSLPEAFILELCEGSRRYDGSTTFDIMEHIFTKFAKIDNTLILKKRKEFEEAPSLLLPLGVDFKKQKTARSWKQTAKSQSVKQTWY